MTEEHVDARELELREELDRLIVDQAENRVRIRVLERTLVRIDEEREATEIDKLLGLR